MLFNSRRPLLLPSHENSHGLIQTYPVRKLVAHWIQEPGLSACRPPALFMDCAFEVIPSCISSPICGGFQRFPQRLIQNATFGIIPT